MNITGGVNRIGDGELVPNLATRWPHLHKLQIWPPDGAICISCKFGHQMAPLALVEKFGQHMAQFGASLAMFPKLATSSRHLYCFIALDCPIGIIS